MRSLAVPAQENNEKITAIRDITQKQKPHPPDRQPRTLARQPPLLGTPLIQPTRPTPPHARQDTRPPRCALTKIQNNQTDSPARSPNNRTSSAHPLPLNKHATR